MRQKLLQLQTDQVMDNLIRAHQGLPIIHLDYSNLTGQVTTEVNASVGGSDTHAKSRTLAVAGLTIMRSATHVLNWASSGKNANQLSMTANPVTNNNDVYAAYLQYLAEPGGLLVSCEKPDPCACHLCAKRGDCYYWVPIDRASDFFKLSLATTAMRGQPLKVPRDFEPTIQGLAASMTVGTKKPVNIVLFSVDAKIPSAEGVLKATVKGVNREFTTQWIEQQDLDELGVVGIQAPAYGKDTSLVLFAYSEADVPSSPAELAAALQGKKVTIRLPGFTPPVPSVEQLLDSIRNEASLIRLNQTITQ